MFGGGGVVQAFLDSCVVFAVSAGFVFAVFLYSCFHICF